MNQGPITAEQAMAEIVVLQHQAQYHKSQRRHHRREGARVMERLAELRAQCEAHGIIFEAEAESHGQHTSTNP